MGAAYVRREARRGWEGGEAGQDRFHRRKLRTYNTAALPPRFVGTQAEIDVA